MTQLPTWLFTDANDVKVLPWKRLWEVAKVQWWAKDLIYCKLGSKKVHGEPWGKLDYMKARFVILYSPWSLWLWLQLKVVWFGEVWNNQICTILGLVYEFGFTKKIQVVYRYIYRCTFRVLKQIFTIIVQIFRYFQSAVKWCFSFISLP